MTAPTNRLGPRLLVGAIAIAMAALIAAQIWLYRTRSVVITLTDAAESDALAWQGRDDYVLDDSAGHRPRAGLVSEFKMGPLPGGQLEDVVRHSNALGMVRASDYPDEVPRPRVLLLGDSHVMGIVSTADNMGTLLEQRLRTTNSLPESALARTTVFNAGCGFYSLYQYALRANTLLPKLKPQALVVVVFTGNDLLELEDVTRPHLSDSALHEGPKDPVENETTSSRKKALALPAELEGAFWQGLNQAMWSMMYPPRHDALKRKIRRALQVLTHVATQHDARPLVVLLPPFDLVFPDRARNGGDMAQRVVDRGDQQRWHDFVRDELDQRKVPTIDMLPAFRAYGEVDLYAVDFHVWKPGHRLIADAVAEKLASWLRDF